MNYQILTMAGRCRSGADQSGQFFHAVPMDGVPAGDIMGLALCGKQPGRKSVGWSCYPGSAVTCEKCLKRLQGERNQ